MFKENEIVVYPGYGVARVTEISDRKVGGESISFYKLKFIYKDMTVLVPLKGLQTSGVRAVSEPDCINKVLSVLSEFDGKSADEKSPGDFTPNAWNKRFREYQLKIQKGQLEGIAEIYKDLMQLSFKKDLSFGEKNLLATIEDLLIQELLVACKLPKEELLKKIKEPFQDLYHDQCPMKKQQESIQAGA